MPLILIFIQKLPFLIPFTRQLHHNCIFCHQTTMPAFSLITDRQIKSFQYLTQQSALDHLVINTKYNGTLNCLCEDTVFSLFPCLLVFTRSEIYPGSGFNDKKQQICLLSRGAVSTVAFTQAGTATALKKNTGHSKMYVFSTCSSTTTTEFWPKMYLVFPGKGFFLTNRLWIKWELDSFTSEPKSTTYRLCQAQERQLL